MDAFEGLFSRCHQAFKQSRTLAKALDLAYGKMNCLGKHTVTGMITASGQQFKDWSASYRLFDGDRMDIGAFFSVIRKEVIDEHRFPQTPIYGHLDDTHTRKRGRKIAGTSWMRDPLGPPFHTNFIWGQRFIQLSLSLPDKLTGACQSRGIPVDFHHCPSVKKPKPTDPSPVWEAYKQKQKEAKLSQVGAQRIQLLRENLNKDGAQDRMLILSVDGSYTNETVIKQLPDKVTLIGRVRKDCRLYGLPDNVKGLGRNRVYGEQLPTPEQMRQSCQYSWQQVQAWAAGKLHQFDVKVLRDIRWRKAGNQNLQLVVIRPLGYRLTKNSRILYRQPAYLICTDPRLAIEQLLQAYLWRWEIEVNFRDEKTLMGCGQAQVRKQTSVEKVPAFTVAIYALMLLAAHKSTHYNAHEQLPRAKWYYQKKQRRQTTGDIINSCRAQIWAKNAHINFSHFANLQQLCKSRKNTINPTLSAAFYMRN